MGNYFQERIIFFAVALVCLAYCVHGVPLREQKEVTSVNEQEDPFTNELGRIFAKLKRKRSVERVSTTSSPAPAAAAAARHPKNAVLILSHDPYLSGGNATSNHTVAFEGFPVKRFVKDVKARTPDDPLLVMAPRLVAPRGSYDETRSCKAALDNSIATLLDWARTKRHMITGYLASERMRIEEPFFAFWQGSNTHSIEAAKDESKVKKDLEKVMLNNTDKDEDWDEGEIKHDIKHEVNKAFKVTVKDELKEDDMVEVKHTVKDELKHKVKRECKHKGKGEIKDELMNEVNDVILGATTLLEGDHAVTKRSIAETESPINDKFQKIGIEDKGSGILYKKLEIAEDKTEDKDHVHAVKRHALQPTTRKAEDPIGWDFLKMFNRMRRSLLDNFLRGLGFGWGSEPESVDDKPFASPLLGLVENTLTDLAKEGKRNGYILVVSGSDENEVKDLLKLIQAKTDPLETLVTVTGMCPESTVTGRSADYWQFDHANKMAFSNEKQKIVPPRQTDTGKVALYATGPGSEMMEDVKTLWDIPAAIKNITSLRPLVNATESEVKEDFYHYKSMDKKAVDQGLIEPFDYVPLTVKEQGEEQGEEQVSSSTGVTAPLFHKKHTELAEVVRDVSALNVREPPTAEEGGEVSPSVAWLEENYGGGSDLESDVQHTKNSELVFVTGNPPPKDALLGVNSANHVVRDACVVVAAHLIACLAFVF